MWCSFLLLGCDETHARDAGSFHQDAARPGLDAATVDAAATDAVASDGGAARDAAAADAGSRDAAIGASVNCARFELDGDPVSERGATFVYDSSDDGVAYRLTGILLVPPGEGPFPAVIVSHGRGGSASGFGREMGVRLRGFGLIAIATDYTHGSSDMGGLAPDEPGNDFGASPANIARARKAIDLLACVPSADTTRLAAHGHSMGAFVTAALAGSYPGLLSVASHTAGGVPDANPPPGAPITATPVELAERIITPYQLHHGTEDCTVRFSQAESLARILAEAGTEHELVPYDYPGTYVCPDDASPDHRLVGFDEDMLARVQEWYRAHGLF